MKKHRGTIAILLLTVVGVAGTLTGIEVYHAYSLPDPKTADMQGLIKWLVLRDLENESAAIQTTLIARFEQTIQEPIKFEESKKLDKSYLQQLQKNTKFLRKKWFHDKVAQYDNLPTDQRKDFMDRQIHTIDRWYEMKGQLHVAFPNESESLSLPDLYSMIPIWSEEAEPTSRRQIESAVHQGLIRWLATSDMAKQSAQTRVDLVRSLEKNMADDVNLSYITSNLSAAEQKMYWHNVDILAAEAFYDKAAQYNKLPSEKRGQFLHQLLEKVSNMSVIKQIASNHQSSHQSTDITTLIKRWITRADAVQQPMLRSFLGSIESAMFARTIFSIFKKK